MVFPHRTAFQTWRDVFDPRYRDLLPLWRRGEYLPMASPARKILVLEPKS